MFVRVAERHFAGGLHGKKRPHSQDLNTFDTKAMDVWQAGVIAPCAFAFELTKLLSGVYVCRSPHEPIQGWARR